MREDIIHDVLIVMIGLTLVFTSAMVASAWPDDYQYRKEITLTGGAGGVQTDYQVLLNVTYNGYMQPDFDDIQFTNLSDVPIDAWLESNTANYALVWAEFPTTPAHSVEQTYYMYYGDPVAESDWDISATMLFGDDFSGTYPGTKWTGDTGYGSVTSGILTLTGDGTWRKTFGNISTTPDMAFGCRANITSGTSSPTLGFEKSGSNNGRSIVYNTGLLTTDDSATSQSSSSKWTYGTWYTHDLLQLSGTSVELLVDGVSKATHTTRVGTISQPCQIGSYNSPVEVDWIYTRKYVVSPATYIFGSEEEKPIQPKPTITSYYNNITGTSDHVPLDYGTTVMFDATANGEVSWAWTLDGVDQGISTDSYIYTFASGFGYYEVTVNATNDGGAALHTWGVWENIETTAETIPTFADTSYQMLLASIDYPPDMEEFGKAMAHPFVQMVGVIFYLFIFGIPLLMMYIRQDNMTLPTTLLLLFGSIIIFMLPPQWQIIAGALMTLGFVGILFKLYKERER